MYVTYGLVDDPVWWDDKMIEFLQIMNKYQRNPTYSIDFMGSIQPHTINQNNVYAGLKTIIIIYVLGKFIKVDYV